MSEFIERVKHHFGFSPKEIGSFLVAGLLLAFMFGFDDGRETFRIVPWLTNYILMLALVFITLLFRVAVQKIIALSSGFHIEFKSWSYGLIIGVGLTVLSGGKLLILLPGSIIYKHLTAERLGDFRYGLNYGTCGKVAALGSVANMFLGMFLKEMMRQLHLSSPLLDKLIYINFLIALFMILPIPPLDGVMAFYGSRLTYVILLGLTMGYVILYVSNIFSLFWALIIAVIVWAIYYIFFEKEAF